MSGVFQVDKNRIFIPLKDGQELLRLDAAPIVDTEAEPGADGNYPVIGTSPARCTQVLVRAKDGTTPAELRDQVAEAYEQFWLRKAADRGARDAWPAPVHVLLTGERGERDRRIVVERAPAYAIVGKPQELTLRIDDGPGVDDVSRGQVFEPFFTTHGAGTGLGLYIARELCEASGASLELLDAGPGAHFRIRAEGRICR
jgi:hypothetical protein